jgi:hypothetical protein
MGPENVILLGYSNLSIQEFAELAEYAGLCSAFRAFSFENLLLETGRFRRPAQQVILL